MASSSTSSIHKAFKYDVFLSFRGEDTRKNFIDHLYSALKQKGIYTYKDDEEIKKGGLISDELIGSIKDSRFYIIVFSKNYASSSWCLGELLEIMECQKMSEHTVYPVFYDVEPTEIRNQTGAVGEAFKKHENDESAGKWKGALKKAADLAGWELKNTVDGHEAKFIQKIVEAISKDLPLINFVFDDKLVGMDTRVKVVISHLETDNDDVRMIGIWGIGGGGKTTLARAVFDHISFQFEGKSFVVNVREVSKDSLSGLTSLQKKVLTDVSNDGNIYVADSYDGINKLKRMIGGKKVLLVLDDVNKREQLNALAGDLSWFGKGSRIIITTRDVHVLGAHGVKCVVPVNLLSTEEAICLFSKHALIGREIPIEGYEELSERAVCYAAGLPLTITVLGSFLCDKEESEWKDTLERLKSIPLEETLQKLELSYDGLEKDHKEIFLTVACILKGWRKELAIEALESCGLHPKIGLKVLEQRSLISYTSPYGLMEVGMHDHLEEMGRNIVRRDYPDKPKKHSRLWIDEEIQDIFANDLGTKATRYIQINCNKVNVEFVMKGLRKMKELRFLHLAEINEYNFWQYENDRVENWEYDYSNRVYDSLQNRKFYANQLFPEILQYLHWYKYPLSSLPNTFQGENLVALKMPWSKIVQLWEGGESKVLKKLKFLDLSCSEVANLNLELTPNLEDLSLRGCHGLVQIDKLDRCPKLKFVDVSYSKLKTVDLRSALNLELLYLNNCNALEELHLPADGCQKLTKLHCTESKLKTLDLGLALNLQTLILKSNEELVKLHMPGECLNLTSLELTDAKLRTLNIGLTPNLEHLNLKNCYDLEELHMTEKCQKLMSLNISHSKLKTLDLGLNPNLENLQLTYCHNLVQLQVPIGYLENVVYLDLSGCLRFKFFAFNKKSCAARRSDESLEVGPIPELHLIAKSLEKCPLHPDSTLPKLQFECFYKEGPSLTNRNLEMLISVGLCACTNLETFSRSICGLRSLVRLELEGYPEAPKDLGQLDCLEELTLSRTNMKHLPDSICMLKHLRFLDLKECFMLEKLPKDFGRLECLKRMSLSSANIKHLPDSICKLKHLIVLDLKYFFSLEKLPEDLGRLECLEELRLSYTMIKNLPDSICMLKHLIFLKLIDCPLFEKLPEDLDRLECLKTLDLSGCKSLRDIPISICKMKRLERLDVSGTCISHLPQNICLLKGLHISGSRGLLESCGFTSDQIQTFKDTCYVDV